MSKIEVYQCDRCKKIIRYPDKEEMYRMVFEHVDRECDELLYENAEYADLCQECMEKVKAAVYGMVERKEFQEVFPPDQSEPDPPETQKSSGGGKTIKQSAVEKKRNWAKVDYEQIDQLYRTTDLTVAQVAKKCGCSEATVYTRFKKMRDQKIDRCPEAIPIKNYHKGTCVSCSYWNKFAKFCDYNTSTGKLRLESVEECTHWRKK